jgi:hypothetical protein
MTPKEDLPKDEKANKFLKKYVKIPGQSEGL